MQIPCPCCGLRAEIEFTWEGPADITRPLDAMSTTDAEWAGYLFTRDNTCAEQRERWCHTYGCGQWFLVKRDTLSHRIEAVE